MKDDFAALAVVFHSYQFSQIESIEYLLFLSYIFIPYF